MNIIDIQLMITYLQLRIIEIECMETFCKSDLLNIVIDELCDFSDEQLETVLGAISIIKMYTGGEAFPFF